MKHGDEARHWVRGLVAFSVLSTAVGLGVALWLQFHGGFVPCSLCIYQRLAAAALALLAMGALGLRIWRTPLLALALVAALGGAGIAGWQWHLATGERQAAACSNVALLSESYVPAWAGGAPMVAESLHGEGSCAAAGRRPWLGLPMALWGLGFFAGNAALLGSALFIGRRGRLKTP